MAKLSAEAKVGLLVLAGSIILLYMTFAVGKYEFGERKGYRVYAVFDSVSGIDAKAAVRMAGVKIGSVEKVELADSRAKLTLRIYPEVKVLRSSQAMVKTMGLLGEKYVEIIPPQGHAQVSGQASPADDPPGQSPYLQEGETIAVTVSPADVDKLIGQLSDIASDVKQVTASLRQVFGTERGTRSMEDILADLRKTMANIQEFSHTLRSDGGELVMRLNELTASLNDVVGENRDNLRASMENIREATKSAELALASIENATKKVERGEGTLGKLVNEDTLYSNIDNAAKSLGDYAARVERMKTIVSFRYEYMFPKSKGYFDLYLKPKPDKYYILGVNTDSYYKYTQTVATATPPGATVTSGVYEDRLRFTLLFAKRWDNIALRLGLIESTGGIGGDLFLFDDRLKVSVDGWNNNSKEPDNTNVYLKGTVTYHLGKTLFLDAGYNNALNSKRANPFIGLGLQFDDEDLKYVIGTVPVPGK
jgi:phospholipid/cholesterol/gamma-HCH transport system substrate-binding protein